MRVTGVSRPRLPDIANDDWLSYTDSLVVALDGCGKPDSIVDSIDTGCRHGVPWYVNTLGPELIRRAADPETPLRDALADAIGAAAATHRDTCDLNNPNTPSSTVVMLRERGDELDYLALSDSCIVFSGADGGAPQVVTDIRLNPNRPRDTTPPPLLGTAERIAYDEAARQRYLGRRNQPGGFWIAGENPAAAAEAVTGNVATRDIRTALVATDGATRLVEFGVLDWEDLLDIVERDGIEALITRTREAEASDPQARRWTRGKQYDDATAAHCFFRD